MARLSFCDRSPEFFEGKLENLMNIKFRPSGTKFASLEKAASVMFDILKLIAH